MTMITNSCEGYGSFTFMCLLYCRIIEPLVHGDYPISMKKNAGARIPTFTTRESEQLKGSSDFIGVIYYNNVNVTDNPDALKTPLRDILADMAASLICTHFVMFELNEFKGLKLKLLK